MGRRTKCTPAAIKTAVEVLEDGAIWSMVAAAIGVSPSTLRLWMARGRRGERPFSRLYSRATIASAKGGIRCLRELHLKGLFLPSAWILERRFGYCKTGKLSLAQLEWTDDTSTATDVDTAPTRGQTSKVEEALQLGATFEMSAGFAGVDPLELRGWLALGRAGEEPHAALLHRATVASGEGGMLCLRNMRQKGKFLPNAWLLERRWAFTQNGSLAARQLEWSKAGDGVAAVDAEALRLIQDIDEEAA